MFVSIVMFLCAAALALLVYRYDMYEKEPWYLLVLVLGAGAATGWGLGFVEDEVLALGGNRTDGPAGRATVAALFEESTKLLIVALVALLFRRHFNDPIDGLIYGAFAGLGAAVEESLFYIGISSAGFGMAGTEAVRLLLHMLMGGLGGFGLGMARFRMDNWAGGLVASFTAAVAIHFSWDFFCGLPAAELLSGARQRTIAVVLMLISTALFGLAVFLGARWSRAVHAPKSRKRLWGWPFSLLARRSD